MTSTKDIVKKLDGELRHKSGVTGSDYVEHYCKLFSEHAYASKDDSWNQLEKQIVHVLGMYIYCRKFAEIMGFDGESFDPRDIVWEYEDKLEKVLNAQREMQGFISQLKSPDVQKKTGEDDV